MGTSANAAPGGRGAPVPKDVDFANYFCTYAFLYHQKDMLSDRVRMDAYFNAIFENKKHFAGKVSFFIITILRINHLPLSAVLYEWNFASLHFSIKHKGWIKLPLDVSYFELRLV